MTPKVVADASVLIASVMADGKARHALLHSPYAIHVPPRVFEELERKIGTIARRARVDASVVEALFEDLRNRVEVVPEAILAPFLPEALARAREAGAEGDEDYVAAALALDAPIWTYDRDFARIRGVRLIGTLAVSGQPDSG